MAEALEARRLARLRDRRRKAPEWVEWGTSRLPAIRSVRFPRPQWLPGAQAALDAAAR